MALVPGAACLTVEIRRKAVPAADPRDGAERLIIENLRFTLEAREIVALVGPSGCGKTTLLRLIGGLDRRFEGDILWRLPQPPRVGTIFQEPRLLPWRTVRQNLALVDPPDPLYAERLLEALGLGAHAGAYPSALSLGLARRVAIARALAVQPDMLLLDEPFVSLDPPMATLCRNLLIEAWRRRPTTALLVTHDRAEAASLADRILYLSTNPARVMAEQVVPLESRRQGYPTGARVAAAFEAG